MGTVPQGSTTVGALSESVGGQLSESVGVCRSCRRTIVGALSDCRNRAQVHEVVAGVRGCGSGARSRRGVGCVTGCSENSQTAKCRRLCCQMLCLVVGMTEGRYVGGDGLV